MTDREMLELAAKAAGYKTAMMDKGYDFLQLCVVDGAGFNNDEVWSPLDDDGDALRLAVKLKMRIGIDAIPVGYVVVISDDKFRPDTHERIENDAEAATRRAIVRAAAEIGKAMQAAT